MIKVLRAWFGQWRWHRKRDAALKWIGESLRVLEQLDPDRAEAVREEVRTILLDGVRGPRISNREQAFRIGTATDLMVAEFRLLEGRLS